MGTEFDAVSVEVSEKSREQVLKEREEKFGLMVGLSLSDPDGLLGMLRESDSARLSLGQAISQDSTGLPAQVRQRLAAAGADDSGLKDLFNSASEEWKEEDIAYRMSHAREEALDLTDAPERWVFVTQRAAYYQKLADGTLAEPIKPSTLNERMQLQGLEKSALSRWKQGVVQADDMKPLYGATGDIVEVNGQKIFNSYVRPTLTPAPGNWDQIRLVLWNLVGHSSEGLDYVLDYLATVAQNAHAGKPEKMGVALCFFGSVKGAGKDVTADVLRALLGRHNVSQVGQDQLDSQFNSWADGKQLIICNEVFSSENRGSKGTVNRLKTWITERGRMINPKNVNAYQVPDTVDNFIFFSNDLRPVVIERGDRRFSVFKVHGKIPKALGAQVANDARAGGPMVAAFLDMLLKRASAVKPYDPPFDSQVKKGQEFASSSSGEKFAFELLERGVEGVAGPWVEEQEAEAARKGTVADLIYSIDQVQPGGTTTTWVPREKLVAIFAAWCAANRFQPMNSTNLYAVLEDMVVGYIPEKSIKRKGKSIRCVGGLPMAGKAAEIDLDEKDPLAAYDLAKRRAQVAADELKEAMAALNTAMAKDPAVKAAAEAARAAEAKVLQLVKAQDIEVAG